MMATVFIMYMTVVVGRTTHQRIGTQWTEELCLAPIRWLAHLMPRHGLRCRIKRHLILSVFAPINHHLVSWTDEERRGQSETIGYVKEARLSGH